MASKLAKWRNGKFKKVQLVVLLSLESLRHDLRLADGWWPPLGLSDLVMATSRRLSSGSEPPARRLGWDRDATPRHSSGR